MPNVEAGPIVRDANIVVDFDSKTVGGMPATISEGQMTWAEEQGGGRVQWTLNRFTGRLVGRVINLSDGKTIPAQLMGECARPTERKF
jgi:hypothetical protein